MLNKTTFIVTIVSALIAAPVALANDMDRSMETETKMSETETAVMTRKLTLESEPNTEVMGTVDVAQIAVEGMDGRIYYNRIIPISELPDPELDLRTLETYEFEHNGVTFTNQIVQELN